MAINIVRSFNGQVIAIAKYWGLLLIGRAWVGTGAVGFAGGIAGTNPSPQQIEPDMASPPVKSCVAHRVK